MENNLRIRIEEFKARCLQIGIDLNTVAYIAEESDITNLLERHYGIRIKADAFDEITISGIRVVKKI